jgi:hypothetical protein
VAEIEVSLIGIVFITQVLKSYAILSFFVIFTLRRSMQQTYCSVFRHAVTVTTVGKSIPIPILAIISNKLRRILDDHFLKAMSDTHSMQLLV